VRSSRPIRRPGDVPEAMGRAYGWILILVVVLTFAPVGLLSMRAHDAYDDKTVFYRSYTTKVKTLDPAVCGDVTSAEAQSNVYESLYEYHYLKRPMTLVPQLAAAMPSVSDDGRLYTIPIKPGIRYCPNACFGVDAQGRPTTREVRAEDFVLAIKRIADFHIPAPVGWSMLSGRIRGLDEFRARTRDYAEGDFARYRLEVAGLRAVGPDTLEIELNEPWPQLTCALEMDVFAPIPQELITYYLESEPVPNGQRRDIPMEKRTAQITQPEQMVGTGPYRLTAWERGSRMIFERNPVYAHGIYPAEGTAADDAAGLLADAGKRLPFIDVLYEEYVPESLPAWMRFLSRQTDVAGIPRDVFDRVVTPDRELERQWADQGIRLIRSTDPSVFWIAFNMDDPIVGGSISLRRALCLGFNVEDFIDVLFNGRARRAVNILPSAFPEHEAAGPGPYYHYDPDAARALLNEARRELGAAGRLTAEGRIPVLTLDLGGRDEMSRRIGDFVMQQWRAMGLEGRIVLNDWPTLQQKVHNKQVQMYMMGWQAAILDPENFLQLFYSPNIEQGTNGTNYRNPDYDALYDRIRTMPDSATRRALYVEMVQILNEDVPLLLLMEPEYFVLAYDWVKNYKRAPIGYGFAKYYRIDTDVRRRCGGR
jgi:oligopeptide transport system substrate-binding protein